MTDLLLRHFVASPDALSSLVGEETVILHLGNDTYFGLDALGTSIWTMLQQGLRLTEIRDRLAESYNVDSARVEADMRHFIEGLLQNGLLVDAPGS